MSSQARKNTKLTLVLIGCIALIGALGIYLNMHHKKPKVAVAKAVQKIKIDGVVLPEARHIGNFSLTDNKGKKFTKKNLRGHWTLLFFGFTNCGYVCPTTLAELSKAYDTLEKEEPGKLLPQVVMVSVDPERDTTERLDDYLSSFDVNFRGARGSLEQTNLLAKQMSATFAKIKTKNGHYTVNHSAEIMLLDPDGNLKAFFSYPHKAKEMVQDYETIMKSVRQPA